MEHRFGLSLGNDNHLRVHDRHGWAEARVNKTKNETTTQNYMRAMMLFKSSEKWSMQIV